MSEEKKKGFIDKLSGWVKGWGVFMAVVTIGATLFIKLEVLTFSSAELKYTTEEHVKNAPNDVDVYVQGQELLKTAEEFKEARKVSDSIIILAKEFVTNGTKNQNDAIKSRAKRDSLLQLVVEGEIKRDSTVFEVVKVQKAILTKLDSLKKD